MLCFTLYEWSSLVRKWLGFTLCFLASTFALCSDAPNFTFSDPPGAHAVGFRVVHQYDYSRTYRYKVDPAGQPFHGELARPIQTLIWYPAQKNSAAHVTYGDYLALFATEENFSPAPAEAAQTIRDAEKDHDASSAPAMWAVKDAKPEAGVYPVVIYAPSFSAPAFENADLCEYLASHGYVVVASPDMGAYTRDMTANMEGIDAQAHDISFLIGFARTIPQADLSQIAVAGFSWGGISNFFAAARDSRITALVALDGSARYYPKLIEDSKYVRPQDMSLPLLFFTQSDMSLENINEYKLDISGNVLNEMKRSDVYIVHMHDMRHGDFSSLFQRSPRYWKDDPPGEYSPQEAAASYSWMAQYVLQFLNATLKHDSAAMAFLKNPPAKDGVPLHMLATDVREAKGFPPTIAGMAVELNKRGFNHAGEVYAEAKKEDPDLKMDNDAIDSWGYQLMQQNHLPEAIEIFKLNISLHPDSSHIHVSLGEAYEKSGRKDLAISNYKKALEIDPENKDAAEHLKTLQAANASPQ
jgi:dienelactone hydrolase